MTFRLLSLATMMTLLVGCVSTPQEPLAPGVAKLEHQFILNKDDAKLREGTNATYALLERDPATRSYRLVALSNKRITMTRSNQELIFLTRDFSNAVPGWEDFSAQFGEDKNGVRQNHVFSTQGGYDRKARYTPASSRFAYEAGRELRPTMAGYTYLPHYKLNESELRAAISQANVLDEARAWVAGQKKHPSAAPPVGPKKLPALVMEITTQLGSEKDRFYFVPSTATGPHGEVVDEGSELYFDRTIGMAGSEKTAFDQLTRFRVDQVSPPKSAQENLGCTWAYMDVAGKVNDRQRFCGYDVPHGGWALPLWANSPTLGNIKIHSLQGTAYRTDGTKLPLTSLSFSVDRSGIKQYRVLAADEAASVKLNFR